MQPSAENLGTLLIATLLSLMPMVGGTTEPGLQPGARILVEPPRLALLARHLGRSDAAVRWDFASITLDVLLETYQDELRDAARERPQSEERRAKLIRWRRATADLAAQIRSARLRLLEGAEFSVYADPQHQVLIVVDGRPIAVSGPRPNADRTIEERIIQQFCGYNDCSPLTSDSAKPRQARVAASASWVLGEKIPPTFEIYGVIRCEFRDIADRQLKAEACRRAADEAQELAEALAQAERLGYRIDWDWLTHTPRARASAGQLVVNTDGAYLALPTAMLARLTQADWQDLVGWLRRSGVNDRRIAVLREAHRLIE